MKDKTEQLHCLGSLFAPEDGQQPDLAALDAAEFSGWRWFAAQTMKGGADPRLVYANLDATARAELLDANPQIPPPIPPDPLDAEPVPALPESCRVDPALGRDACAWLDEYIGFSRQWSPRAYDGFHEACGIWTLSTVAARRVQGDYGGERYTNLYIALCARSSLWAKSTTTKIAKRLLKLAGLDWLLAADDATPQAFIASMNRSIPPGYDTMDDDHQAIARLQVAFPGQRGWFFEELGQKVEAILNPRGYMAEFRSILRRFDDDLDDSSNLTISRGLDYVARPYLALLGNLTPADLQDTARAYKKLWSDGFWARFGLVTPPRSANRSKGHFPQGKRIYPATLITPLQNWHKRLGQPQVEIDDVIDEKGKVTGQKTATVDPFAITEIPWGSGVFDAINAYHDGLTDILEQSQGFEFDTSYARFAEKALRMALLFASFSNSEAVEMKHWARAQEIAERWRANLHETYAQVNAAPPSEEAKAEDKVCEIVGKLGTPTAADVARYVYGKSRTEVSRILDGLVAAGSLARAENTQKGTSRYAVPE
jgi:hypothetical protein